MSTPDRPSKRVDSKATPVRFGGGVYSGMVQRTGEGGAWLHHLYQVRCERYNRLQIDHNALVRAPFRRIFEEARQRLKTSEGNQGAGCTAFAQDMENVAKLVVCQESNVNGEKVPEINGPAVAVLSYPLYPRVLLRKKRRGAGRALHIVGKCGPWMIFIACGVKFQTIRFLKVCLLVHGQRIKRV
ncbi:MAG: hypothetical protein ACREBR_02085 [bacterium]